jgi:predicted dehydrogenase
MAYELVGEATPSMGILLRYPTFAEKPQADLRRQTVALGAGLPPRPASRNDGGCIQSVVGFVGSGNYATAVLIPAFKEAGAHLKVVASSGGVSSLNAGRKFGFEATTTDTDILWSDENLNAVAITTRHDSHASFVLQALTAGKHVFVEKPLCLTLGELGEIQAEMDRCAAFAMTSIVMVGFNRRFAPHVQKIKSLLRGVSGPKAFVMTVNAGAIPTEHWTQDLAVGGGRIIGEACHFIDLLRYLAGAEIVGHSSTRMDAMTPDTVTIQLSFADGSIGTVHYFANGSKAFPKERLEVFAAGRVLQMDNFRKLTGFAWPGFRKMNLWRQDKGQKACVAAFVNAIRDGGVAPIPFAEIVEVTRVSIELAGG